jgi:hypothetical protein
VHLAATMLFTAGARPPPVDLSLTGMDDAGMWAWAAILTAFGLVASFAIAVAWQRRKDKKQDETRQA